MFKKDIYFWISVFIVFIGLAFRWYGLDIRPLHHDESIHVMFGRYFFDWPNDNYYKYNPEYHGPLLYNLLRFIYETFGDYEWSARGLIAFFGSSLLILPFLFRKYLNDITFVGLVAFISFSPTMIYWSKFVREDIFVIAGMAIMLYGVVLARPEIKSFWVLLGVVFQYASKENSYVTMALFWVYFVAEWTYKKIFHKSNEPLPVSFFAPLPFVLVIFGHIGMEKQGTAYVVVNRLYMDIAALLGAVLLLVDCFRNKWREVKNSQSSLVVKMFSYISYYRGQFLASLVLASFLFSYLFSAGFRYSKGILDGLYFSGITYWLEKHDIERIKGPFLFHFYQLSWYEFLFMALVVFHVFYLFKQTHKFLKIFSALALLTAVIAGYFNKPSSINDWVEPSFYLWKKFKAKDWFDVTGSVILLTYPVFLTLHHWFKKEWNLAFFAYAFSISFFTYSYLGEKVPWLSSYPLIMGWTYLALFFTREINQDKLKIVSQDIQLSKIIGFIGWLLLILGIVFTIEDIYRFNELYPGKTFSLKSVLNENQIILILGIIAVSLEYFERKLNYLGTYSFAAVLLIIYSVFTARVAYLTNFEFKFRELGYITQVHTTHDALVVAKNIRKKILEAPEDLKPSVLVTGDGVWPLTWYFRDLPTYKFSATEEEKKNFNYIFEDQKNSVPSGFKKSNLKLRGWWVPDLRQMTLKRFLTMSVNLRPWGGLGYTSINYLEKE